MGRIADIALRVAVPMLLALAIATPAVAAPVCAAPSSSARTCAETCARNGYMPIACAEQMADGGMCGDMDAPMRRPRRDAGPASGSQQPPAIAAPAPAEALPAVLPAPTVCGRAGRADLPPLDPLGTRIRI